MRLIKRLQLEQMEREKANAVNGCDSCKTGVYKTNSVEHPQYKYCPMCGRKLGSEKHG